MEMELSEYFYSTYSTTNKVLKVQKVLKTLVHVTDSLADDNKGTFLCVN